MLGKKLGANRIPETGRRFPACSNGEYTVRERTKIAEEGKLDETEAR